MNTSNLTIKVNKKSAFQAALGMILICAIFIFVIFMDLIVPMEGSSITVLWFFRAFSLCILPMSISAFIFFVKKLFSDKPIIEVCDEYFYDDATMLSLGRIPWSNISYAAIEGQYFTIYVKDRDAYLKKANPLKRLLIKMNIKQGLGEIVITPALFDASPMEFFRAFNSHFEIDGLDELEKQLECEERVKNDEK